MLFAVSLLGVLTLNMLFGQEGGGTHFKVRIISSRFEGLPAVRRHQLVYSLLDEQFRDGLHALNIVARTPAEDASSAGSSGRS